MAGHRKELKPTKKQSSYRKDLESGPNQRSRSQRFRDVEDGPNPDSNADKERIKLKEALQKPMEGMNDLKRYRKSDKEVGSGPLFVAPT